MATAGDEAETKVLSRGTTLRRPCSRITWTDAVGTHTAVVTRAMVVGSATKADAVIADETVSRLHAELDPQQDGLWVRDLDSRNGTFVGDMLVVAARVPRHAHIRVGGTTVTVEPDVQDEPVDLWPEGSLGALIGNSVAMRELYANIVRVGASDAPVLIHGETGSGKELVAKAIHDCSHRASKPFVVLDCAALPEALLESELFGHAKGSFTGASAAHTGTFESAEGGTVFLDEIGELPLAIQPKLLRVLESKTVRRVGETAHRRVQVRFVTATHRDLRSMVNGGSFREDLFFRLAVLPIRVPPLRERVDDIPELIHHYAPSMSTDERGALAHLLAGRKLAGNVRELRNIVERAQLRGGVRAVDLAEGPTQESRAAETGDLAFESTFHAFQEDAEREYLRRLMVRHGGQVAEAAEAAGVNRTYLYRLLRKQRL